MFLPQTKEVEGEANEFEKPVELQRDVSGLSDFFYLSKKEKIRIVVSGAISRFYHVSEPASM